MNAIEFIQAFGFHLYQKPHFKTVILNGDFGKYDDIVIGAQHRPGCSKVIASKLARTILELNNCTEELDYETIVKRFKNTFKHGTNN